ncbi:MAG: GTPase [Chloroflexota bacterium]
MPANLTPQYLEAERNFRQAKTTLERIACLDEMLAVMPKHKGTDHLRADLRTKIAKLTQSLDKKTATQRASMMIEKVGAAQVAVIGLPNVGKSQIVASLTKATPTVAAYPFTTQTATPGMMAFENIQVQLIDTPPLSDQPPEWWLLNIIRRADGLLAVVDITTEPAAQLEAIIGKLLEKRIGLGKGAVTSDEEVFNWKKTLVAGNKADLDAGGAGFRTLQARYGERLPVAAISATGSDLGGLRSAIFRMLDIIRIYTKAPGGKPDMTDPIILEKGSTLEAAATAVHKDFAKMMKYARIWGSGKFDGVMAKRDHVLQDGDIIELHA